MPVSGIGATPPAASSQGQGLGSLDSEAFLKLLVAQLRYQNPMEPTDTTAMMQQSAQFTQVETLQNMAKLQQQVLGLNEAATASGLLGKEVTARRDDGTEIVGEVTGVKFTQDGPVLAVGADEFPLYATVEVGGSTPPTT